jgi:hypothetical protein
MLIHETKTKNNSNKLYLLFQMGKRKDLKNVLEIE